MPVDYRRKFMIDASHVLQSLGYSVSQAAEDMDWVIGFCDAALSTFDLDWDAGSPAMKTYMSAKARKGLWSLWVEVDEGTGLTLGSEIPHDMPRIKIVQAGIILTDGELLGEQMDVDVTCETDLMGWLSWAHGQIAKSGMHPKALQRLSPRHEIEALEQLWESAPNIADIFK
jgi:hypothetical protein